MRTLTGKMAALALLYSPSLALGADDQNQNFVGDWDLVNWVVMDENGKTTFPYGPDARGQIIYTADGEMAVQLMRPNPATAEANAASPQSDDLGNLARYFAYYGTYTVDREAQVVTHHLESALEPSWIGTKQERAYRFVGDDRLILSAKVPNTDALAAAAGGENALTWQRADAR